MTIKKYSGSEWVNQAPKTTAAQLFTDTTFGTSIFDANTKLKVAYLPDSVFDSLFYQGTTTGNVGAAASREALANILHAARLNSVSLNRSFVGSYFVISAAGTISALTGIQTTVPTGFYYTLTFSNTDGTATAATSSGVLEVGDWFVVNSITGAGTSGSPFVITAAVISNTYEVATSSYHGIVKLGYTTNVGARNYKVETTTDGLYVNVPWVQGTYEHFLGAVGFTGGDATNNGINVIDSVTVNAEGHVTGVGTRNLSAATASAPGHMTAADKTKLDGIASGAQVNVGTNLAQGTRTTTTVPVTSSTGDDATLEVATTLLAGVMSSADKSKLDGIATGATANVGTVTSVQISAGTGISGGGTITGSGNITITNSSPNATHTGDVTGSGYLTIANNAVVTDKINNGAVSLAKMANLAANSIIGNNTGSAATPLALTPANVRALIQTKQFFVQTGTPGGTIETNALWYDIN
jgi:hypothetical protein